MNNIRAMQPSDYEAVAALSAQAAAHKRVGRPVWRSSADVQNEISQLANAAFIVTEDESGQVVGFTGYRLQDDEAEIYGPLVSAAGHGIGAWLSSRIEAMAAAEGATAYSLLIGLENGSGAAWAEWRGYLRDSEFPATVLAWIGPEQLQHWDAGTDEAVRQARPDDLSALYALYQACYPQGQWTRENWAIRLPECWVYDSGRIVGFLHFPRSTAKMKQLGVDPSVRRTGVGSALMVGALTDFWKRDHRKVGIRCRLDNQTALSLLRSLGFKQEVTVGKWMKR
jgi:ribosomal protein S18 acetylase RimI-like enzyme